MRWRLLLLTLILAAALVLLDQFVELLFVLLHGQLDVIAQRRHHVLLSHAADEIKLQCDTSHCSLGSVDIKSRVAF